jgi:MSHA biogenesis protein MshO
VAERPRSARGYTLIELIIVVALIGALAGVAAVFIVEPFRASRDISQRAKLTDQAELVVDRIVREVRAALPNSVRVATADDRTAVEFVATRTGGRYRRLPAPGGGGDPLNRAQPADTFDALGGLPDIGAVVAGNGGTDCANGNRDCLSIFNTGQAGFNVYDEDNIAEVTATVDTAGTDRLTFDTGGAGPAFAAHSPRQRFFVFDDVVSFVCDDGDDELLRYATYGLAAGQQLDDGDLGGNPALLADDVTACEFTYDEGTATRQGLLTIDITLSRGGESVRLLAQAHVVNAP